MHLAGMVADAALGAYGFPGGHPFGPDRLQAFLHRAHAEGLVDAFVPIAARTATDEEILRFHTPEYLAFVRNKAREGTGFLDAGDTPAFPGVDQAAARVVGSVLAATEAILQGTIARAFVPIAGLHHARRDAAAGFCVFNDIGVVIETLKAQGITPILYLDIDVHHGDGVFYAYEDDPEVWIADIHEDGRFLYPGTGFRHEIGTGKARGTKRNLPLPPGADDAAFLEAWRELEAFAARVRPAFVILQCGADALAGDPLAHLRLSERAHAHAARRARDLAEAAGHGRLLALGGGGYNHDNLARAWCAVLEALR